jgi:hypothetical protein
MCSNVIKQTSFCFSTENGMRREPVVLKKGTSHNRFRSKLPGAEKPRALICLQGAPPCADLHCAARRHQL